ncbi:MAG: VacJ family lipoprotein [Robiginitomaculum sp.]|nr:VacJ family lipoprotein [Robiginitomaculum sp.]MDQ7078353.1 VacJ family lipoprotein [Robiginitomaculum sp.]
MLSLLRTGLLTALFLSLYGCAHPPWRSKADPLEPMNRVVFAFNTVADKAVLKPVAKTYQAITPKPARKGIRNFLDNLQSPVILANDLLQGKWKRAAQTTARFAINSTVGLGGVLDVAKSTGLEKHYEDFGQTLATKGISAGPYLVLPLFGPTNARDLVGLTVDLTLSPLSFTRFKGKQTFGRARLALNTIDRRAETLQQIDIIRKNTPDEYVSIRSYYEQIRKDAIADGVVDVHDLPDFDLVD